MKVFKSLLFFVFIIFVSCNKETNTISPPMKMNNTTPLLYSQVVSDIISSGGTAFEMPIGEVGIFEDYNSMEYYSLMGKTIAVYRYGSPLSAAYNNAVNQCTNDWKWIESLQIQGCVDEGTACRAYEVMGKWHVVCCD